MTDEMFRSSVNATLYIPERSEWYVIVSENVTWYPTKGKEPCWFHRKMQELCFGFKWRKHDS